MRSHFMLSVAACICAASISATNAQEMTPEMQQAMEFFGNSGNPEGKWIEGETFVPHVESAPHFKAAML